jgi:nucleoside-diphosphate kinase
VTQRTLILIKPDAVARGLTGEIITRIERKGLRIARMDLRTIDRDVATRHYAEHADKPFYEELVGFITSGPLVAMIVEGADAVGQMRTLMGATKPVEATPGSIRGDLATEITTNLVHGSDSSDSATREIETFFGAGA